ncbi:unnamed protein product [Coregonus sp. 'balchen']|nr:unnamed protein product [Coregonus sp. 'balchen']
MEFMLFFVLLTTVSSIALNREELMEAMKATNLAISATLNKATLAMMKQPWCGIEDSFNDKSLKYQVMATPQIWAWQKHVRSSGLRLGTGLRCHP